MTLSSGLRFWCFKAGCRERVLEVSLATIKADTLSIEVESVETERNDAEL